jgi:single-strand DNA-binding protein
MANFAFVQLGGALGKDPEVRSTGGGKKVVSFSLAVNKGFGDNRKTHWFNVSSYGKTAEFAEKYLTKGKGVVVSGELDVRSWEDRETGQKRTVTEIVASNILFADSKPSSEQSGAGSSKPPSTGNTKTPPPQRGGNAVDDDEIPF